MSVKICGIEVGEYDAAAEGESGVRVEFFYRPGKGVAAIVTLPDACVEGPYAPTREESAEALHAMILRLAKMVDEGRKA